MSFLQNHSQITQLSQLKMSFSFCSIAKASNTQFLLCFMNDFDTFSRGLRCSNFLILVDIKNLLIKVSHPKQ